MTTSLVSCSTRLYPSARVTVQHSDKMINTGCKRLNCSPKKKTTLIPTLCLSSESKHIHLCLSASFSFCLSCSLARLILYVCGQEVLTSFCDISLEVFCSAHLQFHARKSRNLTNDQDGLEKSFSKLVYWVSVWSIFVGVMYVI